MRYEFRRAKKEVTDYMVQLELMEEGTGKWVGIRRHDVSHGFPHVDIGKQGSEKRKVILDSTYDPSLGYSEALEDAVRDVRENWKRYCSQYTEGDWAT